MRLPIPSQRQVGYCVPENIRTWANAITLGRMVLGVALFAVAALRQSPGWNYVGLAAYWGFDMLDGLAARALKQETRLGAQLDILVDRLLISFFYFNVLRQQPQLVAPIVLFLIQFMVLDHYLSNQFLRWPIRSPNYFYVVDPLIWQLNWSVPGKMFNTGFVTVLLLLAPPAVTLAGVLALIAVKLFSCVRLHRLPARDGVLDEAG
jgi:CDP-diacylglycerol---glycerol-3-phosphate 3-phosphatidyltransferase